MSLFRSLLIAALAVLAATAAQAKRVALVIGNSEYTNAPALKNPTNDATAMAEKFRGLGFETVEGYNLDFDGMRQVMRDFARTARDAEIATIFYAGHGIAVDGVNYLVPIDASLDDPIDWEFQVYDVEELLRLVRYSTGASLVFLDACRDNPLTGRLAASMGESSRSVSSRGLARVEVDSEGAGMAIAFATSPGEVAQDGQGDHSPFTEALLNHIGAPNTDITEVMSRVTGEVYASTDQAQRPWINASLTGPVVLNRVNTEALDPKPQTEAAPTTANAEGSGGTIEVQKFMFEAAMKSEDAADFQAYLDLFPDGLFAQMARNAIARIETESEAPTQLALAQPNQPNADQLALTRTLAQPLSLTATPALRAAVASQSAEQQLFLTKTQRREVQGRLNAAGHNVGGADGVWGPRTRAGISAWQAQNGLTATSFLNAGQFQLLRANTEAQYQTYLATRPVATPRRQTTTRRTTSSRSSTRRSNPAADAFVGGLVGGIIGGAIGSR